MHGSSDSCSSVWSLDALTSFHFRSCYGSSSARNREPPSPQSWQGRGVRTTHPVSRERVPTIETQPVNYVSIGPFSSRAGRAGPDASRIRRAELVAL